LTVPLFVIFIAVPAIAGFVDGYWKLANVISEWTTTKLSYPTPEEKEVLDQEEWVLRIASYGSKEEAEHKSKEFKEVYRASGHINVKGKPIWINDILVVRDPKEKGRWLIVIDQYPGASSRQAQQDGLKEMLGCITTRELENTFGRWLKGAAPFHYTKKDFESTYGLIAE
jgi:hypothetical protein